MNRRWNLQKAKCPALSLSRWCMTSRSCDTRAPLCVFCVINFQRFNRSDERDRSGNNPRVRLYAYARAQWNRKREGNSLGRSWGEGRNVPAPGQPTQTYGWDALPLRSLSPFLPLSSFLSFSRGCWLHVVYVLPPSVLPPSPTLKSTNSCHRGAHIARFCSFTFVEHTFSVSRSLEGKKT